MEKDEILNKRQADFRQTNAYAMQNGIILGVWAIVCQACFVGGLRYPLFSNLWLLMLVGVPFVTWLLTSRFRSIVGIEKEFSFGRGFMHSFLTLLYTAVWAAVATFVYLQFFDKGYIFDCYQQTLSNPNLIKSMEDSGLTEQIKAASNGLTPLEIVDEMRSIGAANYAALIIYIYMFTSPLIAVMVGLVSISRGKM